MITTIIKLCICHFIGDYFLQGDFIAQTKGDNLYHLIVHCVLYCVPFCFVFGIGWQIALIFITHIIIDLLKAKWNKINYATDQILHFIVIAILIVAN